MPSPQIVAGRSGGAGDQPPGHLILAQPRPVRQILDGVPIAVAGGEGAAPVGSRRVTVQQQLDLAHLLKPVGPVEGAQGAHAADGVADRDLVGGLALVFLVDERLDRFVWGDRLGLQPGHQPTDVVFALVGAQAAQELGGEGDGQGRVAAGEGAQHAGLIDILARRAEQPLGPGVRLVAQLAHLQHLGRQSAEVLHQPDPQHDRDGPQLAHAQRCDRLVGVEEAQQRFGVHAAIGMPDQLQGDGVDAGQPGQRAVPQLRELAVVARRQVVADGADLLVDDVEVIDQPLGGRADQLVSSEIFAEALVGGRDLPPVALKCGA